MDLIVAVDNNWGIGKDNELLFHIKEDMEFFKRKTNGRTLLMGRKTFESLPNGKPLPGRKNLVLTKQNLKSNYENLKFIHSLKGVKLNEVMLIGGGSLYKELLNKCKYAYVTRIDDKKDADTFFPNLDKMNGWKYVGVINSGKSSTGLKYQMLLYRNVKEN